MSDKFKFNSNGIMKELKKQIEKIQRLYLSRMCALYPCRFCIKNLLRKSKQGFEPERARYA